MKTIIESTFTEFTLHKPEWLQLTLYTTDSTNASTEGVYTINIFICSIKLLFAKF